MSTRLVPGLYPEVKGESGSL